MLPQITAMSPALPSTAPSREPVPTRKTSAAATPSGYGKSDVVTNARRSGIVNITPSMPPTTQTPNAGQNGKPLHQPTITKPGSTKIIDEIVPAADATVCTILFSQIVPVLNIRKIAIEMTAAGIDDANVRPTFKPR